MDGFKATGVVVAALAVIAALVVGVFALRWFTADPRGKLDAREDIKSGPSRIVGYEHFFNLCASVQANEGSLSAQYDQLDATNDEDEQERIRANIAGLTSARAQAVAQYNADARKDYTIGQFRDSDLPYEIPDDPYKRGVKTSCEA